MLDQLLVLIKLFKTLLEFYLDAVDGFKNGLTRRDIVGFRINGIPRYLAQHLPGQWIEQRNTLDLVIKQLDPHRLIIRFGGIDIDQLAANPVGAALQLHVIALVLKLCQSTQDRALIDSLAPRKMQHHLQILTGVTQAVDRGDRRHHDDITAFEQGLGRRKSHLLDMFVHRGIFFDEGIRRGNVGLGLIIVVVGDEILDRIVREKVPKFAVELRRQCLVGGQDDCRALHPVDYVRDTECFARTGHSQQGHSCLAVSQSLDQAVYRGGLVTRGLKPAVQLKRLFCHKIMVIEHDSIRYDNNLSRCQEPKSERPLK